MIIRWRQAAEKRPRGLYRGGLSFAYAWSGAVAAPVAVTNIMNSVTTHHVEVFTQGIQHAGRRIRFELLPRSVA